MLDIYYEAVSLSMQYLQDKHVVVVMPAASWRLPRLCLKSL